MWIIVFTGALVLVGFLQYYAMRHQEIWMQRNVALAEKTATAARDSAEAATATVRLMRRYTRRQMRARVFVVSANRIGDARPSSFEAEILVKNYGKVPAYKCTCAIALVLRANPPGADAFPRLEPTGQDPRLVLPPDDEFRITRNLSTGTFENRQHGMVGSGSQAVYYYGWIQYRDGFGKKRQSSFLMRCCGADYGPGRFSFCESGNDAN
jgi:hypothetical protein